MPRRSRLILPGVPVHVVQRGNNRQACFLDDEDRRSYVLHLARLLGEERCALHAYCLMSDHVHLLLTAQEVDGYARLMQRTGQLHTQYMNRKYKRTGSLWEGRFHSSLVQCETYLLTCYRYIDCNPVRAGIAVSPERYAWSSFRANAFGLDDPLVTPHAEYERLGSERKERQQAYAVLVREALPADAVCAIRNAASGNFPLGDSAFAQRIAARLGRRAERGKPGRPRLQDDEPARQQPRLFSP